MATKKQRTPAQEHRYELAAAIRARAESGYNIWLVRPPFETRDLVLSSDLQFETFYLLEGEPCFKEIRYLPQWYKALTEGSSVNTCKEFAVVTTDTQETCTVRLRFEAESGAHAQSLRPIDGVIHIDVGVLDGHLQRIENWRRIIPCVRRVQLSSTKAIELQISTFVGRAKKVTLRELKHHFPEVEDGIFFGSVGILLRRRELQADVDSYPWSLNTSVWSRPP